MGAGAIFALVSVNLIGQPGVLLFFAGTGAVMAFGPLANGRELLRFSPLLLLPLLAILSTIWSDAPQRTMRLALELFITFTAAIVLCRNLRPERLLLVMFLAFVGTAMTLFPAIPGSLAGGYPLKAYWGSKNVVGFVGYMVVALALAVMFDRSQPWPARLAGVVAIPLGLLVAMLAQSGGTTTTILLTLLVFPPLALLGVMKPPVRIVVIIFVLLLFGVACFFLKDINAAITDFRVNVLKKDATLTGRTYLWDFAERLSEARPVLGYGYGAFWRQGNIDAEGLWRWGGIASRSGFNFHNAFVEMRVEMGMVGMVLLFVTCAAIGLIALVRQAVAPSVALASLIGMTAVLYVRSYVEDGLVGTFSLSTVIWLATAVYALSPKPLGDASTPAIAGEGRRDQPPRLPRKGWANLPERGKDRRRRGFA